MKVLMFGWEYPPHISGGLGTACYGLTKGLYAAGDVELLFVVPKAFGDEEENESMRILSAEDVNLGENILNYSSFLKDIKFIEINSRILPYTSPDEYEEISRSFSEREEKVTLINTMLSGNLKFTGGYGPDLWQEINSYAVVASRIAKMFDFDIIHAHDWLTFPAGVAAKQVSGKPLVVHVHATDFDRSGGSVNPGVFEYEKRGMEAADKIIAVSNLTRNTIIYNYHMPPEKVVTVHNAVEPTNGKITSSKISFDEKIVTFLGRVTLQKGPEYFIEAAYKVLQKTNNVRFVMAGSGELLPRMIERVAALKMGDRFHFTGFLKGDQVDEMFALSDVYVMPSVSEPFGISPLEAMQSDVPVIISKQSGVAEILKHAIKIDFWDIDAMADAIYGIIKYPGLKKYFDLNAKAEVNSLKWENAAIKVKNVYQQVLA